MSPLRPPSSARGTSRHFCLPLPSVSTSSCRTVRLVVRSTYVLSFPVFVCVAVRHVDVVVETGGGRGASVCVGRGWSDSGTEDNVGVDEVPVREGMKMDSTFSRHRGVSVS